jgi:hypothetical protein
MFGVAVDFCLVSAMNVWPCAFGDHPRVSRVNLAEALGELTGEM